MENIRVAAINESLSPKLALKEDDFQPLRPNVLQPDTTLMFDLFMQTVNSFKKIADRSTKLTTAILDKLYDISGGNLFLLRSDDRALTLYVESNFNAIFKAEALSKEDKASVFYETACNRIEMLFEKGVDRYQYKEVKKNATKLLELTKESTIDIPAMTSAISTEYSNFHHAVDVSFYSIIIGLEMGLDEETLNDLAIGAMVHDIGKTMVHSSILEKAAEFNENERKVMRRHLEFGEIIIRRTGESSDQILECISQHHEKMDGSGYPYGLKGSDIPLLARIVAIADIFSALTTNRVYKGAITTFEAFTLMKDELKDQLDQHILAKFILLMAKRA